MIRAAIRDDGMGIVVPISRGISRAEDPHAAAMNYRDQINSAIERVLAERKVAAKTVLDSTQKQFIEAAIRAPEQRFVVVHGSPPFRCSFLRPSIPHSAPKANDLCIPCPGGLVFKRYFCSI